MERRLGRVAVVARQGLSSVSVSVSVVIHDRVSCGEMRHASMGHGKARATREMERDFRFGRARARPTMVGSLLIFNFVRMEEGDDARGDTYSEEWISSRQGSTARSDSCSSREKDDTTRRERSVERWRERDRRRGVRASIRPSASEHAACVGLFPAVLTSSARMCSAWSTGT
jgi:hypothetical protein